MTDGTPAPTREIGDDARPRVAARWESAHDRWLVAAGVVLWAVAWAIDALMGWDNAWPLLVPAVLAWRRVWSPYDRRRTREATGAALRRHADPGAEIRKATEGHAQESLARSPWPAWGLAGALLALAAGCAVVGWQRDDGWDAAPAPVLLAVAIGVLVVDRMSRQRARRWLGDPPYAARPADRPA